VVATSREAAIAARAKARISYHPLDAVITAEQALAADLKIAPTMTFSQGDSAKGLATAPRRISGGFALGGQDHFYLEGQIAMAVPGEDGDMLVYSSTQHPTEVQHLVGKVLAKRDHAVTVEVRRMGGGFGGKETSPAQIAAIAALAAAKTGRPAKLRLDRDDDMVMTGKRHDFLGSYDVGFDESGRILGLRLELSSRCGRSLDLSNAINDRAMFHADNCYFLEHVEIISHRLKTHTVSNTAFRGFGGPQGMFAIEYIADAIAADLGLDPLTVRRANFYDASERNTTPYGMVVEDFVADQIIDELETRADYAARRAEIVAYNAANHLRKRGIALTPVKFGISFTAQHYNQAGALVHVYSDGSIHLNHGGTEMGQGLFTKVAQVVAEEFQVPLEMIKITATTTAKVPNTSATAASSGSDLNGMAAQNAAQQIKARLGEFAARLFGCNADEVHYADGRVSAGSYEGDFADFVKKAYFARVQLSAAGFYATPKIHFDRDAGKGRPFYYFAYGAAVSEVEVDTLTGEYRVLRADLLHDTGRSLNPAIDIGQVEGAFIQGMGWLTTEELVFGSDGSLRTHAPSTYKIPAFSDRPAIFNTHLWSRGENVEPTIFRSKAVGEPPFMLAISVFSALRMAIGGVAPEHPMPQLDAPLTPERVLLAMQALRDA
jgi:xanthine dehydrogenase large subunit